MPFLSFSGCDCVVCFSSAPEVHREGEGHNLFLSVQCSTCMCVSFVHVWRLLKCVNSDNTPYCPPRGCRDIAISCLRCRKAREKKKRCIQKYTEIVWNIPCRKEVQIGMDTLLEPPGYNFILKRRFCCVQL